MVQLKHTKNIDYFIVILLPYLEQYLLNNPSCQIIFHANEYVCIIISIMFGRNIITQQIKNGFDIINSPALELDIFLKNEYAIKEYITNSIQLSKPLQYGANTYLKSRKYVCVFPKCQLSDPFHNMTHEMLNKLNTRTNINKFDTYIIGFVQERLNPNFGKEVDNFIDILDYFKYCKLFITSESMWKYVALLCNCRNVIVLNTQDQHVTGIIERYNPFNNNIYTVSDLCCQKTYDLINTILR